MKHGVPNERSCLVANTAMEWNSRSLTNSTAGKVGLMCSLESQRDIFEGLGTFSLLMHMETMEHLLNVDHDGDGFLSEVYKYPEETIDEGWTTKYLI